jgi:nitroreductase
MYEEELRFFMKRRSIRSFQDRPVEEEKVEFLLKAAATAATAIHQDTESPIPATETAIGCFSNDKFASKLAVESRKATFCTGIID